MISRRMMLAGTGASAAMVASGALWDETRAATPAILRAPRLQPGARIGLIEPASLTPEPFDITLVEEAMAALGLEPVRGDHVLERDGYLAGEDRDRAKDINSMFRDKSIDGVFAVRGGWGSARVLPFLDYDAIKKNPKPLLGYSDITALHLAIHARTGLITFHGPNAMSKWGANSVAAFKPLLFDGEAVTYQNPIAEEDRLVQRKWRTQTMTEGKARGRLIGGNLTVMTALVGTPYLPSFDGAILFLEDVDEAIYRVDRMLTQLGQAGVLKNLRGVIFGFCTDCDNGSSYSAFTLGEVLQHHLGSLGVPAYRGAYIGHIGDQFTVPIGAMVEIDADAGAFKLLEPAVL
ncbi:MAG: LD-carboxypeptidase [Pseudomonadota bacterium]